MAYQIGTLADGQKRVLRKTSHELSSPIARMQVLLGILESSTNSDDVQGKYMVTHDLALRQMGLLVQELLALAKANLRRSIETTQDSWRA